MRLVSKGELALALLFVLVGALWIARAARMPLWEGFAPDSGFLPLVYGALLLVLSLVVAAQLFTGGGAAGDENIRKPLMVIGALVAAVTALPLAGFVLSVFALLLFLYAVVERLPWIAATVTSAVTTAVLYLIFKVWLGVPLPAFFS